MEGAGERNRQIHRETERESDRDREKKKEKEGCFDTFASMGIQGKKL